MVNGFPRPVQQIKVVENVGKLAGMKSPVFRVFGPGNGSIKVIRVYRSACPGLFRCPQIQGNARPVPFGIFPPSRDGGIRGCRIQRQKSLRHFPVLLSSLFFIGGDGRFGRRFHATADSHVIRSESIHDGNLFFSVVIFRKKPVVTDRAEACPLRDLQQFFRGHGAKLRQRGGPLGFGKL